jgi:hypothetical protein
MNCPKCEIPMEMGTAEIHGTPLGFFALGRSFQPLLFIDMKGKTNLKYYHLIPINLPIDVINVAGCLLQKRKTAILCRNSI